MQKRIKVLQCIRQGQIGGGESHLLSLVENLDKTIFDPVVLSFTDGPMVTRLREMNVPVHIIHTTRPFDITKWKAVRKFLKEHQFDLIHAHGTRANSNILWAAKSLGIPVIYTIHGWSFHPDQSPIVKRIRIMGEKYLTSKSDMNISVSASNQKTGKDQMPSFSSVVVNNGIDLKRFNPLEPRNDIRTELGIAPDKLLVLFIARFTLHKQPLALIRAFASAIPSNPNMHLLMAGDGDQKEEAEELILKLHAGNHITLLPFRQDVPDVLASADIFVLPSLWEGLPIGLLEAMAMGKTIIASNVDGTSEIISHNENGWLVDTQDLVTNLADALVALGNDENKRKELAQNAIQTVSEKFNAANMTRKIEKIYRQFISSRQVMESKGQYRTMGVQL